MGRVVAIANQKGGVGKTTTAVNLAASLAVAEQRVLLIDLDPQGNASTGVGVHPRTVERGAYRVLLEEATLEEETRTTEMPGLDVLPATQDLVAIERELVDVDDGPFRLRAALERARELYDFVLIDCPPSLGLLTVNALTAADFVLVPLQCEYYALEGLSQLVGTVEVAKTGMGAPYVRRVAFKLKESAGNMVAKLRKLDVTFTYGVDPASGAKLMNGMALDMDLSLFTLFSVTTKVVTRYDEFRRLQ